MKPGINTRLTNSPLEKGAQGVVSSRGKHNPLTPLLLRGNLTRKICCSIGLSFLLLFTIHYSLFTANVFAADKWPGVDESVVEKYAKEHGREARTPFINTDQGDLLLFVFLLAGTIGGFAAGYYWRILMVEKAPRGDSGKQKTTREN